MTRKLVPLIAALSLALPLAAHADNPSKGGAKKQIVQPKPDTKPTQHKPQHAQAPIQIDPAQTKGGAKTTSIRDPIGRRLNPQPLPP
jgi:hypothetical protein